MKQMCLGLSHFFNMHFCSKKFFREKDWIFSLFPCYTNWVDTSEEFNHENVDLCIKPFLKFLLPIHMESMACVFFIWLESELKFWKHIFFWLWLAWKHPKWLVKEFTKSYFLKNLSLRNQIEHFMQKIAQTWSWLSFADSEP